MTHPPAPAPGPGPAPDPASPLLAPDLRLSPDQFYWAVLPNLPARATEDELLFALEASVPADIDSLEARFARTGSIVIGCAMEKDRLHHLISVQEQSPLGGEVGSVRPADLPAAVTDSLSDPDRAAFARRGPLHTWSELEFRSGAFESPSEHRRRRRITRVLAAGTACGALLLTTAVWLDAYKAASRTERVRSEILTSARDALTGLGITSQSDPLLRLAAELRTLQRTHDKGAERYLATDQTGFLVDLLTAWPDEIATVVESVQIDQDAFIIRGKTRAAEHPDRIAAAISPVLASGARKDGVAAGTWGELSESVSAIGSGGVGGAYQFSFASRRDLATAGSRP